MNKCKEWNQDLTQNQRKLSNLYQSSKNCFYPTKYPSTTLPESRIIPLRLIPINMNGEVVLMLLKILLQMIVIHPSLKKNMTQNLDSLNLVHRISMMLKKMSNDITSKSIQKMIPLKTLTKSLTSLKPWPNMMIPPS